MTQSSASSPIEGTDPLDKPPSKAWRKWIVWALIPAAFALGIGIDQRSDHDRPIQ